MVKTESQGWGTWGCGEIGWQPWQRKKLQGSWQEQLGRQGGDITQARSVRRILQREWFAIDTGMDRGRDIQETPSLGHSDWVNAGLWISLVRSAVLEKCSLAMIVLFFRCLFPGTLRVYNGVSDPACNVPLSHCPRLPLGLKAELDPWGDKSVGGPGMPMYVGGGGVLYV